MFSKGLLGYLPANILQGLVGFATLTVFTRILSPDDYGRYAMAFGVSSLAQTLCFTWIEASMARFYPAEGRHDPDAPALYGTLYRLFIALAAIFTFVCVLGLWLWPAAGPLKLAIGAGLATVIFRSQLKLVQEQRRSEGRVAQASLLDMLVTGGGFALGILCALAGLGGGAPVAGIGLLCLIVLPFAAREDWGRALRGTFDWQRAKTYVHYGFPVSASLILSLGLYTVDRFLIAHYMHSDAEAGAYHAGFSLASRILDVLFIWFGAAGAPAMVHALETQGESGLKAAAYRQISTMAFVLFPAVGGLIMVAPALGGLLIGEDLRRDALSVTPLISLGALFSGLNTYYFLQAFTLAKRTRLLVAAMAIPAIANIALNVLLIPRMGLMGAAIASCASFAIGLLGSWLLGLKTLALPVPPMPLLKIGFATAAMMAVLWLLPLNGGFIELILKAVFGVLIYGALTWVLNLNDMRGPALRILNRLRARLMPREAA